MKTAALLSSRHDEMRSATTPEKNPAKKLSKRMNSNTNQSKATAAVTRNKKRTRYVLATLTEDLEEQTAEK
jgi:hypothetical protein